MNPLFIQSSVQAAPVQSESQEMTPLVDFEKKGPPSSSSGCVVAHSNLVNMDRKGQPTYCVIA
ncbi:hypothetical protein CBOM_00810 [Ceraceosorus bombacis]|uniref:Uncharacterized protein n=1 Tax=Ceraceosorus bombacis TaxID=401625 RepID=A0A0P1BAT6_9BASI|nr:hypothetical protein CBOM_00810 [Ceraceosorus bombacis]